MEYNEENWPEFTEQVMTSLLTDGSDPDAIYTIEHHISSSDFKLLEAMAVAAFKLGYEVDDAEELESDSPQQLFSFDITLTAPLDSEVINIEMNKIIKLCEKYDVDYDGWGTYFQDIDE